MNNPYRKVSQRRRQASQQVAEEQKAPRRVAARKNTKVASKNDEQLFDQSGDFNPQAFDRPSSKGMTSRQANRRMFNKEGEVNAYYRHNGEHCIAQGMFKDDNAFL